MASDLDCWKGQSSLRSPLFASPDSRPARDLVHNESSSSAEPRRSTEYELSLGYIQDTLRSDYLVFFERSPNLEIYNDHVICELSSPPFQLGPRPVTYRSALSRLRQVTCSIVEHGVVRCSVYTGRHYGHDLKVYWQCTGYMLGCCRPVNVTAISLYSIAPKAPGDPGEGPECCQLAYRVSHHAIEFIEVDPPPLRQLIFGRWWDLQKQPHPEPVICF